MTYANAPQPMDSGRERARSNGMAIAGLVCGLVGLLAFALVLGPLAIVFGGIGLSRANRGAEHRTMSMWAIGIGVLDIVLAIVLMATLSNNGLYVGG